MIWIRRWCTEISRGRQSQRTGESPRLGSAEQQAMETHFCQQVPQASMNQGEGQGLKAQSCLGTRDKAKKGVKFMHLPHPV